MCIENIKPLPRKRWGTGYKVFGTRHGSLVGDYSGDKTRPREAWLDAKDFPPPRYSGLAPKEFQGERWNIFLDIAGAEYWLPEMARQGRSPTICKVRYKQADQLGTYGYHLGSGVAPVILASLIFIPRRQ